MNGPALACAVLSYRNEPYLADAVRSVLEQGASVEVVVVNSGGGSPEATLSAAGITVPVHSVEHRLYPGAARNVGVALTSAPFVAFLAADCLATPGWAAARIRAHLAGASAVASPLTNADPGSTIAWSSLLLQHNRRLAVTRPSQRLLYSLSYSRPLFDRFGLFREDLRAGEDTEFNARFHGHETVVLAEDAVTAHRYPTTMTRMLGDAFRRGSLQARMQGAIEGGAAQRLRVAASGPRNVVRSCIVAVRSSPPERRALLKACPLVVLGAAAYSAGAIVAVRSRADRSG